ncbi:unnamed protein product [Arctogadus glacialis]
MHSLLDQKMGTETSMTVESAMQGDSQLVGSSQGEVPCSGTPRHSEEPGIEVATLWLPGNPLYLLSNMPPIIYWPNIHCFLSILSCCLQTLLYPTVFRLPPTNSPSQRAM